MRCRGSVPRRCSCLSETEDAERVPEFSACILAAAIGVADRAAKSRMGSIGVSDRLHAQRRFHIRCHCEPQRRKIKTVEQNRNIEFAVFPLQLRNIMAIGKTLKLSPSIPPPHTVRDPFESYGVPSMI